MSSPTSRAICAAGDLHAQLLVGLALARALSEAHRARQPIGTVAESFAGWQRETRVLLADCGLSEYSDQEHNGANMV
jgi:hypothetical protein